LFDAVSSAAPRRGELTGTHRVYRECTVQIGLDEASVVELPSIPAHCSILPATTSRR
jgi:ferrous iron transport protein B